MCVLSDVREFMSMLSDVREIYERVEGCKRNL